MISVMISTAEMGAANTDLETDGYGPGNFSVPSYDGKARPSYAGLNLGGNDPVFEQAVKGLSYPSLQWSQDGGTGPDGFAALVLGQSLVWPGNQPELPDSGTVSAGEYYRYGFDVVLVLQPHDRSVYGGDPAQYPSLIRKAHMPGVVDEWVQPNDQYDAYLVTNPFTGEGDVVTRNGRMWRCTDGSAGSVSKINIWEPGVYGGWTDIGPA